MGQNHLQEFLKSAPYFKNTYNFYSVRFELVLGNWELVYFNQLSIPGHMSSELGTLLRLAGMPAHYADFAFHF
jgi:hypothetical protein